MIVDWRVSLYENEALCYVAYIFLMGCWCLINAVNLLGWREFNGHLKQDCDYCQTHKTCFVTIIWITKMPL